MVRRPRIMARTRVAAMTIADRRKGKVMMAYPTTGDVDIEFHDCVVRFLAYDAAHHQRVTQGVHRAVKSAMLPVARNRIVKEFLELEGVDWLWFVDTDQVFAPDT